VFAIGISMYIAYMDEAGDLGTVADPPRRSLFRSPCIPIARAILPTFMFRQDIQKSARYSRKICKQFSTAIRNHNLPIDGVAASPSAMRFCIDHPRKCLRTFLRYRQKTNPQVLAFEPGDNDEPHLFLCNASLLFDDGLRKVPRLVDVDAALDGHVVGEDLQRNNFEHRQQVL